MSGSLPPSSVARAPASADAFARAFAHTVGIEGGYSNDPADSGGETMYGITVTVARAYGYEGPMREMPIAVAQHIYRQGFWLPMGCADLVWRDELLAAELFDSAVNCGVPTVTKWLQRALNALNDGGRRWPEVSEDGRMGQVTLATLFAAMKHPEGGAALLLKALNVLQGAHYFDLVRARVKDERFLRGWLLNRVRL
jgi:lysozyme family protein